MVWWRNPNRWNGREVKHLNNVLTEINRDSGSSGERGRLKMRKVTEEMKRAYNLQLGCSLRLPKKVGHIKRLCSKTGTTTCHGSIFELSNSVKVVWRKGVKVLQGMLRDRKHVAVCRQMAIQSLWLTFCIMDQQVDKYCVYEWLHWYERKLMRDL